MWKSIIYKEWLKIRKPAIILFLAGILLIIGIYSGVRHDLILRDAELVWVKILIMNSVYFTILKFFPLIIGLLVGIAQFVPEIIDKRIKLTLHLPVNEETVVLKMIGFGVFSLFIVFGIMLLLFYSLGSYYFPYEIAGPSLVSILPWFMAGLASYFLVAFVIMEPIWKYRIFYIILGASFISLFFKGGIVGDYAPVLFSLLLLVVCSSIATLFSIYRFRKGEL
ncbi:MAG TPA: hypothetical protein VF939_02325 [Puia sp.]